ncbi:Adrenocortical dysplasia protein, partial [Podiceps cristatus]
MQLRLSSLICRIIVLQKYTVCFREEARLEDCEFYLTAQRFIVLPMERQRLESSDGNQEPSVLQKIRELWLRSLALKNAPSSEPSISQLIDAIGQNQLEVLKENAEECLDLRMPKEMLVTVKDEVPVTQWEAERKKERGEDVFVVLANTLMVPANEEAVACDISKADTSEAAPGKSSDGRTVPSNQSVVSQASRWACVPSPGWVSPGSEVSLDNPWNRLPSISLTLNSSDGESPCPWAFGLPCRQGSPEALPQGEPVHTSSPSLLRSYGNTSPVEALSTRAAPAAEAAHNTPCAARSPQVSGGSQAALLPPSPAFPSSHLQSLPEGMPH